MQIHWLIPRGLPLSPVSSWLISGACLLNLYSRAKFVGELQLGASVGCNEHEEGMNDEPTETPASDILSTKAPLPEFRSQKV